MAARLRAWLRAESTEGVDPRLVRGILLVAMGVAGAVMLVAGRDLSFASDDLFYYARLVERDGVIAPHGDLDVEYLLAPHNTHLQLLGKLVYEGVFAVAGPSYAVLRVIATAGVLLCVGLFFQLARPRLGDLGALVPSVLLLFFGSAWEVMLWPYDLHTSYALASGLGALLLLERRGRHAGAAACALLCVSVLLIEIGVAFALGVGVWALLRRDRLTRLWIPAVPLVIYASWWVWARSFDQQGGVANADLGAVPAGIAESLSALLASLLGLNDWGPGVFAYTVGLHEVGALLAGIAVLAFAWRLTRGAVPRSTWVFLAILVAYWASIALGGRPPDSSRYLFAGGVLLLLVAADLVRTRPVPPAAIVAMLALLAVAIPPNLGTLRDGRQLLLPDALASRTWYAMLELAREDVDPAYSPKDDEEVTQAGPAALFGLDARTYFEAAERVGSIAFSPEEVARRRDQVGAVADAVLANALDLRLRQAAPPPSRSCRAPQAAGVEFEIPRGGAVLRARGGGDPALRLGRFAPATPSTAVASTDRGWARLTIPADEVDLPWRGIAGAPLELCKLER